MQRTILIDYENVQKFDLKPVDSPDAEVMIFVGKSQNKIPFSLVEKAQALGDRLTWCKIAGDGKNNLDFHIAFELGRLSGKQDRKGELIVLSKDSGYDSLIRFINKEGVKARRITTIAELSESKKQLPKSKFTEHVVINLKKIKPARRPRARGTLKKHIESLLRDKADKGEVDAVLEEMFLEGLISQSQNRIKYQF